tara:strand:+ start:1779 stop:2378 length:600 start_codon:yes stop_codon:yes gene_type:complete
MMRSTVFSVILMTSSFLAGRFVAQDFEPSCFMCPATYVAAEEINEYEEVSKATGITDQQIRSLDIGKTNLQIAVVHRGALQEPRPRSVAEHDLVSETYYVLSGGGTVFTGPDLVGKVRRPEDYRAVRLLNGPGHNALDIRNGVTHELVQGDVFVIPAGTGHQFTKIDDHITYLMVRVDPDKVVPLLDREGSRAYLDQAR